MWAPGGPPGPAGWDRRRVGARLRAALAGLHELQGLRATQQARVRGALAMQPPPGPAAPRDPARPELPRGPRAHELRLEAALAALQEQLNRLRHQDVGLKTHLEQLDRQISGLQLDVSGPCSEVADGDSRPSSGFYELSDGGSCSLSASRTSVCSDRMSSSLGTWLPADPDAGDGRPRSADETTVHGAPLPAWRTPAVEEGVPRPRPVSTGDLERVLPSELVLQEARADPRSTSVLCPGTGLPAPVLDPKYRRDLVSRGGREVYPYPSPLHAVALQSPLFTLHKEALPSPGHSPPREPLPSPEALGSIRNGAVLEAGPAAAYIDKLLRLRGRGAPPRGGVGVQGPLRREAPPSPPVLGGQRAEREDGLEKRVCAPERAGTGGMAQRGDPGGDSLKQRGPALPMATPRPSSLPEEGPKAPSGCVHGDSPLGSPQSGRGPGPSPRPRAPRPALSCQDSKVLLPPRSGGRENPALAPGCWARPPFADRGASLLGQNTGHPKTLSVRIKRGASDKVLRFGGQLSPEGALAAPVLPPEWGQGLRRRPTPAGAAPSRSCSEPRLYPVPLLVPLLVTRREGRRAPVQALCPSEAAAPAAGGEARKKQRRWLSSVEISGSPGPSRPAASRAGGLRPVCARARPRLPRQDARVRSESEGSERSAGGASLLHSTVAETSEDGASDHTASCFGDQESSGSDSEAGAWPRACPLQPQPSRAPGARRPPLPPMPKLCRIKASKALKRKIRRFQPAALRVMTMV